MAHKFKVKGLSDVRLRSDGEEISLEFKTAQGEKLTLVVPGWAMNGIVGQMMVFDRQAQIKRDLPPDPDRPQIELVEPPPLFILKPSGGLACIVRPETGWLDLELRDLNDREIQVSVSPDQARILFDGLLHLQNLGDDQKLN
jgi:hypothetical protein